MKTSPKKTSYDTTASKEQADAEAAAETHPAGEAAEAAVGDMDHMNEASEMDAGEDMASFVTQLSDSEFTQLCAAVDARRKGPDAAKSPKQRGAEGETLSMDDFEA